MDSTQLSPDFILTLYRYALYAFGILTAALTTVFVTIFINRQSGAIESLSVFLERFEVLKFTTVLLIIVSTTFLGLIRVIEGESVVAVLSAIAGYVLGSVRSPDREKNTSKDEERQTSRQDGNARDGDAPPPSF